MKRKMVYAGLSYLVGLFFASHFNHFRQILAILAILLALSIFFCVRKIKIKYYIVCAFFLITGCGIYNIYKGEVYSKIISVSGTDIHYSGKIIEIKNYSDEKSSYLLNGTIDGKIHSKLLWYTTSFDCDYGDTVSFECTPEMFENTYLFNQKDYYESSGIFLHTDNAHQTDVISDKGFSLKRHMLHYRDYINDRIDHILPGKYGAVITAMLNGDKSGLDDTVLTAMYRCGIGHVMAVSGMHLVLLTSLISVLLSKIKVSRKIRFTVIETIMILFVLFTGISVSVIRSAVMLTLVYGSGLFGRKSDPLNSLCIAIIILTAAQPYIIDNPAFILSVTGTFGAAVFAPYVTEKMDDTSIISRFNRKIVFMLCVSASVFPFSVLYFDETSLISPFSNIFIMPVCVFILICGFITALCGGICFIAYPVLIAGGLACKLLLEVTSFIASLRYVSIPLGPDYIPVVTVILTVFILFSVIKYRSRGITAASVIISVFIICISGTVYRFANRDVMSVFRLGTEKNSVLVITRGYNADIIDLTGDRKNAEYVRKTLDRYGIRKVNSVTFIKNPYQSMASFDDVFKLNSASHVYVPVETYIYENTQICGCSPEFADTDNIGFAYEDYCVSVSNDGSVSIVYGKSVLKYDNDGIHLQKDDADNIYEFTNMIVRLDRKGNTDIHNLDEER